MDHRVSREREFHDSIYESGTRRPLDFLYPPTTPIRVAYEAELYTGCEGKRVLEYGCGLGSYAFDLAMRGAVVTGIDISDVAIASAQEEAQRRGQTIDFRVMNAERLEFPPACFDIVCGSSILHHLSLQESLEQIKRVLRPGGKAVFIEPLGHNPAVNAFRRLTPKMRSADEHPLRVEDLAALRRVFPCTVEQYFYLFGLAAYIVRPRSLYTAVAGVLNRVDHQVFAAMPWTRKLAWQVLLVMHPK